MSRVLALVVGLSLALPANAQDIPFIEQPKAGDVCLKPDVAISTAKRLASAEAKVAVYESHPPLPAWGVVLLVLAGVAVGVGGTVIVYEVAKKP